MLHKNWEKIIATCDRAAADPVFAAEVERRVEASFSTPEGAAAMNKFMRHVKKKGIDRAVREWKFST